MLEKVKQKLNEEEFNSYQNSLDINEELARLSHHIKAVSKILNDKNSCGKRIDFIAQEMQREANTMGSKVQDVLVSDAVIFMKSRIERIREQSQNLE